jgi:metal-dependent amidase/aminoacylase/carboxypeptidase family protein
VLFGMHNRPKLAVGRFNVRAGPMMAGGAFFDIDVTGRARTARVPRPASTPRWWRRRSRSTLQTIVSRNVRTGRHGGAVDHAVPRRRRLQRDPQTADCRARCARSRAT